MSLVQVYAIESVVMTHWRSVNIIYANLQRIVNTNIIMKPHSHNTAILEKRKCGTILDYGIEKRDITRNVPAIQSSQNISKTSLDTVYLHKIL